MTAEAEEQKPPTQPTAAPPHHSLPEEWAVEVMSVTTLMSSSTDSCCRSWDTTRWPGGTTTSTEATPLQVTECGLGGGQATRAEKPRRGHGGVLEDGNGHDSKALSSEAHGMGA